MGRLRARIQKVEREAQVETMVLVYPRCGEEMRVGQDTDLEYIAYLWTLESGAKSYRRTPRDVFVIANHPHETEGLIDKRMGEPWLQRLENWGRHHGN
jgi:hypothetical protein